MQPTERVAQAAVRAPEHLSILRNLKIGTFHIGSSMADILAAGVWNRVMIKELGFAATPIALLLALRYFLAPFGVWVGQRSDVAPWRGYHRLPYIWGGRLAMALSYVILGLATLHLAGSYDASIPDFSLQRMNITVTTNAGSLLGWLGVVVALVMFSVGSTFSSTTFLALIYDRAPRSQRTRAVSVVWFFLILGFAVSGIIYSRLLPEYTRGGFLSLFLIAPLIMGGLWFFSLLGEEKPGTAKTGGDKPAEATARPFWRDLKAVWASQQTRLFFLYLMLSTLFFYTQDVILEPFAGQVFGMPVSTTSRFSAYWGSMTLIGIVVCLVLARRFPKSVNNMSLSRWGVVTLLVTFALFFICAVFQVRPLVTIGLVVMGIGLGMWTVGSLGLMMDTTRAWGAGIYLALWTVASTLARGAGVVLGGVALDLALGLTGRQLTLSYGAVFLLQVIGLGGALYTLGRVPLAEQQTPKAEAVLVSAME